MPSILAGLPLPGCAASRSAEATFCGISPIEPSTTFCFPSRAIVNSSLVRPGGSDKAPEIVRGFYFVTAAAVITSPC